MPPSLSPTQVELLGYCPRYNNLTSFHDAFLSTAEIVDLT